MGETSGGGTAGKPFLQCFSCVQYQLKEKYCCLACREAISKGDDGEDVPCSFQFLRELRHVTTGGIEVVCMPNPELRAATYKKWMKGKPVGGIKASEEALCNERAGARQIRALKGNAKKRMKLAISLFNKQPFFIRFVIGLAQAVKQIMLENKQVPKAPYLLDHEMDKLRGRQLCDNCLVSISNRYALCARCGFTCCPHCVAENDLNDACLSCKKGTVKYARRYNNRALRQWIQVLEQNVELEQKHEQDECDKEATPAKKIRVAGVEMHPLRLSTGQLSPEAFSKLLEDGMPVVLTDVDLGNNVWRPAMLEKMVDEDEVAYVFRDISMPATEMPARDYFKRLRRNYDRIECGQRGEVLRLKDWPTDCRLREKYPKLAKDFDNRVPFSDWTASDGLLNIATYHTCTSFANTDLGPKLYASFEAERDGKGNVLNGFTGLHLDLSDAMNIMTFSSRDEGAEWVMFKHEDCDALKEVLTEWLESGKLPPNVKDPLYSFRVLLQQSHLNELRDRGISYWRFKQRVGDAVFIPVGCAHQVANLADTVKVAVDFVPGESLGRTLKRCLVSNQSILLDFG
mmetsp:Transcript_45761/g.118268  ORF Transcript_45761/g.118268 Transcript_45761/m.118268 type:complete len:572 (-) Transcript_45761:306-2021(-)